MPEGPNDIEHKFYIRQKTRRSLDLFLTYVEFIYILFVSSGLIPLLFFIPWPDPELSKTLLKPY